MSSRIASLLLGLVVALIMLSAPTAATAHLWTDDGALLGKGEIAMEPFEGNVTITVPKTMVTPHSTIVCPVTLQIEAEGVAGGQVPSFNATTALCQGTGIYLGCSVVEDFANLSWAIGVDPTPISIKKGGGKVTLRYAFNGCMAPALHLEFTSITVTPTLSETGRITLISLSGTATNGVAVTISGGLTPEEGSTTLGLK